ncbi:MAG: hypothetical protein EKK36_13940 [Bradyrhizobiaceae bacterium]|nr:MAG: hypothetical protein EKK36_13940 [Bradyrhizobiaceae bacterium]
MPSRRFIQFKSRLLELEKSFLPAFVKPLGNYTKKEIEDAEAYIVLSHAEIESLLEYRAIELLQKVSSHWKKGKVSLPLLCLTSSTDGEKNFSPKNSGEFAPNGKVAAAVTAAIGSHMHRIRNNNGIKEEHFCKIIRPTRN